MSDITILPSGAEIYAASSAKSAMLKAQMAARGHDMDESDTTTFEAGFLAGAAYILRQLQEVA